MKLIILSIWEYLLSKFGERTDRNSGSSKMEIFGVPRPVGPPEDGNSPWNWGTFSSAYRAPEKIKENYISYFLPLPAATTPKRRALVVKIIQWFFVFKKGDEERVKPFLKSVSVFLNGCHFSRALIRLDWGKNRSFWKGVTISKSFREKQKRNGPTTSDILLKMVSDFMGRKKLLKLFLVIRKIQSFKLGLFMLSGMFFNFGKRGQWQRLHYSFVYFPTISYRFAVSNASVSL